MGISSETLLERAFLERLERLTLHWDKAFGGLVGGHSASRFSGAGQDFLDHRNFHSGDDLRSVNWRVFLRLERLFSKVFHLEPRIPMRLLIDTSASMGTNQGSKLRYAQQIAASLCYVGLVRLDAISIHPFAAQLGEPFSASGGRHRYQRVNDYLLALQPDTVTNFHDTVRSFLATYERKGLVFILSDFLSDEETLKPLEYLSELGHELFLIQIWDDQDRVPTVSGEVDLYDSETNAHLQLQFDEETRARYTELFDLHADKVRALAGGGVGGRYLGLSTAHRLEEVFVDAMIRVRGAA